MQGRRHDADVLILGYSLEAALTAALVSRRGGKVLWIGGAPDAATTVGKRRVPAAPGLVPSLTHAPTLTRALREIGLLAELQRVQRPISLQYLGERMRISLAEDWLRAPQGEAALQVLQESSGIADELSAAPLGLGFFSRRRFARRRAALAARLTQPPGVVGEATGLIDGILGRGPASMGATLQTVAAPTDLPGGTLTLGQLLQKRCLDHGGRLFADGLQQPFKELEIGWSGISGRLASGELITAKLSFICLDETSVATALPEGSPLRSRFQPPATRPLLRVSLLIRTRGLPVALGTFALVRDQRPLWLERRRIDDELESLTLFWRSDGSELTDQTRDALRELESVIPFFARHVVESSTTEPVPDHFFSESTLPVKLSRRAIRGRGPLLDACGAEGAAIVAAALAEKALRMSGRKETPRR